MTKRSGGARGASGGVLVYRQVLALNFDSFQRNTRSSQGILFCGQYKSRVNHSFPSPSLLWYLLCGVLRTRLLIQFAQLLPELH